MNSVYYKRPNSSAFSKNFSVGTLNGVQLNYGGNPNVVFSYVKEYNTDNYEKKKSNQTAFPKNYNLTKKN
jgi:hypothetical protein